MNGKLGALFIGRKQVGGFLDWTLRLNMADGVDDGDMTHNLHSWRVTAWAHWVSRIIDVGSDIRIMLCADAGPAYWLGKGKLTTRPTNSIGTLTHVQIEIIGSGELIAKVINE